MDDQASFNAVATSEAITLSVGWITGQRTKLRQIAVGHDVAAAFRLVLDSTLDDLRSREGQSWAPDADLTPETYLKIPLDQLGSAPKLAAEHGEWSLIGALARAEDLPDMKPADLPAGDLSFYAITIGDRPGSRAVFLRRSNPRRGLKRGRIYSLLEDTLQRIQEPIFAFDEWMDLIAVGDQMFVMSQTVFAAMFRGQDALAEQVPTWTADLSGVVPINIQGRDRLNVRALRDSRIRARLEAIVRRGHLPSVPRELLLQAMGEAGLDADALINDQGELVMEDADIAPVLYFLNEDLFTGALTSTSFRADKKATR